MGILRRNFPIKGQILAVFASFSFMVVTQAPFAQLWAPKAVVALVGFGFHRCIYLTIIRRARMGSEWLNGLLKAEWAIDSEATRARGIIVLVKSN